MERKMTKVQEKSCTRCKEAYKIVGMSYADIGKEILCSKQAISNYCNGYAAPSIEFIQFLHDKTGYDLDYLFGRSDFKTEKEKNIAAWEKQRRENDEELKDIDMILSLLRHIGYKIVVNDFAAYKDYVLIDKNEVGFNMNDEQIYLLSKYLLENTKNFTEQFCMIQTLSGE